MKGKKDVESISKMLNQGLDDLFGGEHYRNFLKMTAHFPNYSYRNLVLILQQCPHATQVRTFRGWRANGRVVRAGEKAIRIIAPFIKAVDKPEDDSDDNVDDTDADIFRRISVFDILQTDCIDGSSDIADTTPVHIAPYPFKAPALLGDVPGFAGLLAAIRQISPYPIKIENIRGNRKGYCSYAEGIIAVKRGLSQLHTIKTCIHEVAHSLLHRGIKSKQQREIEAEGIAFIVCNYLNLDTSEYSFNYIVGYNTGKKRKEITTFLDTIQKTASYLIDSIDGARESARIFYNNEDLCMITNDKTAMRLHEQGAPVYLVYPGPSELFVLEKKQILEHNGPFAVEKQTWQRHYPAA